MQTDGVSAWEALLVAATLFDYLQNFVHAFRVWKSLKVLKFLSLIFKAWKVLEKRSGFWKSLDFICEVLEILTNMMMTATRQGWNHHCRFWLASIDPMKTMQMALFRNWLNILTKFLLNSSVMPVVRIDRLFHHRVSCCKHLIKLWSVTRYH